MSEVVVVGVTLMVVEAVVADDSLKISTPTGQVPTPVAKHVVVAGQAAEVRELTPAGSV